MLIGHTITVEFAAVGSFKIDFNKFVGRTILIQMIYCANDYSENEHQNQSINSDDFI